MAGRITQVTFGSPQLPRDKNVAAYCRVSSGKDAMRHSLAAQVSYYSELIQNHAGWEYAGVYADEAVTGTKDSRKNFKRMLSECRAGKIDTSNPGRNGNLSKYIRMRGSAQRIPVTGTVLTK